MKVNPAEFYKKLVPEPDAHLQKVYQRRERLLNLLHRLEGRKPSKRQQPASRQTIAGLGASAPPPTTKGLDVTQE